MTFTTGCIPPAAAGLIAGSATVCQGTTAVAYSVPAIAGATSYVWTLPTGATVATGSGTNSITVDFSGTAVSGDISVYGANDCSNGAAASLAVTLNPMPIPTLTAGPLGVCVGSTGVVYQTQAGMTGYTWTISAGGTITAGAGTNAITVTWNAVGAQTLSLNYTNASLCSAPQPAVFTVNVVAQPVPVISGPANACLGFTTNVYSTQTGMSNYAWTLSAGGVITAGAGTNAITVTWNTLGAKTVTVDYTNAEGCTALAPTVYNVIVNPTTSPTISGITELCSGSNGVIYTTQPGFSNYVWNISYGGTITSGLTTNEVVVDWSTAGTRTISVNYSNTLGCAAINPANLTVTVNPSPVPVISGTSQLCQGSTGVAYTTQANFENYVWAISSGGAITSGAGTNAVTVTWNESGTQSVSVSYTNDFGCAATTPTVFNVTVDPKPAAAGTIVGTTPVCAGATMVTYTTAPISGVSSYLWTLPAGATIAEGANTRTIKVNFAANASSGIIKVSGVNDCGPGPSSPNFNVVVNPMPATPVITQNGDTLTSSANTGNQWYLDGVLIPGATGKQHVAVYTGTYTVVVTVNECGSAPSNGILVLPVSVNSDKANRTFDIYPNPNRGEFNIKVETLKSEEFNIEIYNSLGSLIWKQESVTVNGTFTTHVVLSESPSGMYMIRLRNNENTIVKKLIIKN
jgi:large repetitive protein